MIFSSWTGLFFHFKKPLQNRFLHIRPSGISWYSEVVMLEVGKCPEMEHYQVVMISPSESDASRWRRRMPVEDMRRIWVRLWSISVGWCKANSWNDHRGRMLNTIVPTNYIALLPPSPALVRTKRRWSTVVHIAKYSSSPSEVQYFTISISKIGKVFVPRNAAGCP